jgi:hypothetical protein
VGGDKGRKEFDLTAILGNRYIGIRAICQGILPLMPASLFVSSRARYTIFLIAH